MEYMPTLTPETTPMYANIPYIEERLGLISVMSAVNSSSHRSKARLQGVNDYSQRNGL